MTRYLHRAVAKSPRQHYHQHDSGALFTFYLFRAMNEFHIIYYPLYKLIMQVHHDSGRIRDFGCMLDSRQKI
jgi:hypothetical protein